VPRPAQLDANPFDDPFGDRERTSDHTKHPAQQNVFDDDRQVTTPFEFASYSASTASTRHNTVHVPKQLTATPIWQPEPTLQIQGPQLAQSEEPSLDDLRIFDDQDSTPPKPSQRPGGVFDFQTPETNPLGEGTDPVDAPGDLGPVESFPDAPEPQDILPQPRQPGRTPAVTPPKTTPELPEFDSFPDTPTPDVQPEQPMLDPIPVEPDQPGIEPFPTEPLQPEPDAQPIPDMESEFPDFFEPTPEMPEPDLEPDAPFEPAPQPDLEPQTLPEPYEDTTPSLPPADAAEPRPFDPLDEDQSDLQRELEKLEERLGTPELEADERPSEVAPTGPFADDEEDEDEEVPCDRVYDERNCCDQDSACRTAWNHLATRRLMDIELDITPPFAVTPPFAPSPADTKEALQDKQKKLAQAPIRTWRSADGRVLAAGSLTDYRDGQVLVADHDGTQVGIPYMELSHDDLCFLTAWWGLPGECTVRDNGVGIRDWRLCTFTWKASALCHKPLYFQDVQLERYGHSAGPFLQPLASTAHFFANVLLLPYNMGVYPPHECRYPLGHYRPGSCAPWLVPAFPLSERGAKAQLITVLALWGFTT
jgi:hypothetical protein